MTQSALRAHEVAQVAARALAPSGPRVSNRLTSREAGEDPRVSQRLGLEGRSSEGVLSVLSKQVEDRRHELIFEVGVGDRDHALDSAGRPAGGGSGPTCSRPGPRRRERGDGSVPRGGPRPSAHRGGSRRRGWARRPRRSRRARAEGGDVRAGGIPGVGSRQRPSESNIGAQQRTLRTLRAKPRSERTLAIRWAVPDALGRSGQNRRPSAPNRAARARKLVA